MSKHSPKATKKNPRTARTTKPVLDHATAPEPETRPPPSGVRARAWTPRYTHSGVLPGESVGDAIRRYVAWLVLAREELDHGGDRRQVRRDLTGCAETLATLSLEVDALEGETEPQAAPARPAGFGELLDVENALDEIAQDYNTVSIAVANRSDYNPSDISSTMLRVNTRLEGAIAKITELRKAMVSQ